MSNTDFTKADHSDLSFLVATVMAAERSGSDRIGLAQVFGVPEKELPGLIRTMLLEEVDGCEFSLSSFLVARESGISIAAVAGWTEGAAEDGVPSQMLRSNLIGFTFPKGSMEALRTNAAALASMRIDRRKGDLQIEYVHVAPEHRRKGLAAQLIQLHIRNALRSPAPPTMAQVQVFANNMPAIRLYETLGFHTASTFRSDDPRINELLPYHEKLVMEKAL